MKHLMSVALLSSLVAVGCSHDKSKDTQPAPSSELTPQPLPPAPAPVSPSYVAPSDNTSVMVAPTPVTPSKADTKKTTAAKPAAAAAKPAVAAPAAKTYVVKKGDTLSEIAKDHNTTIKKLMEINPTIKTADKIEIGQKIKLP